MPWVRGCHAEAFKNRRGNQAAECKTRSYENATLEQQGSINDNHEIEQSACSCQPCHQYLSNSSFLVDSATRKDIKWNKIYLKGTTMGSI